MRIAKLITTGIYLGLVSWFVLAYVILLSGR